MKKDWNFAFRIMALVVVVLWGLSLKFFGTSPRNISALALVAMGIIFVVNYIRGIKTGGIMNMGKGSGGMIITRERHRNWFYRDLILNLVFGTLFILGGLFVLLK